MNSANLEPEHQVLTINLIVKKMLSDYYSCKTVNGRLPEIEFYFEDWCRVNIYRQDYSVIKSQLWKTFFAGVIERNKWIREDQERL